MTVGLPVQCTAPNHGSLCIAAHSVITSRQEVYVPNDFVIVPGHGIANTDEKKPWDIAVYLSQVFWQAEGDPNRKATILVGGTVGPDDPQIAQYNFFTAAEAYGLMASRPHDRMGVAGWYNVLSDNFKDLVSPVIDLQDTWGHDVYCNFAINKWLHLPPNRRLIENERKDRIGKTLKMIVTRRGSRPATLYQADS